VSEAKANVAANIQPPQGRGGAGGGGAAAAGATSEKLGDGVFLIGGGYAAIAVDMKDHITIIETGQSEARGQAVIAEAKKSIPKIEAVGEKQVLTDGTHTIELYHLRNFGHHDGMLIAYLPKEKVLVEADGYNPQAANATPPVPASPFTLSLVDNIQRLKLDVQ